MIRALQLLWLRLEPWHIGMALIALGQLAAVPCYFAAQHGPAGAGLTVGFGGGEIVTLLATFYLVAKH